MIFITLNMIKAHNPCKRGWETLLKSLNKTQADDEPLKFSEIAESNDISDALWCLRVIEEHKKERSLLLADIAESVLHIYEKKYPTDTRIKDCIEAIKDYANNKITKEELLAFRHSADAAAADAAAYAAAYAAADAADAAAYAAAYAADAAAREKERKKQKEFIIKHLE